MTISWRQDNHPPLHADSTAFVQAPAEAEFLAVATTFAYWAQTLRPGTVRRCLPRVLPPRRVRLGWGALGVMLTREGLSATEPEHSGQFTVH